MPFSTVASTVRSLITRSSSVARAAFPPPSSLSTSAKKPPIPTLSSSFTSVARAAFPPPSSLSTFAKKPPIPTSSAAAIYLLLNSNRRQMASESFKFGPYEIDRREVFYSTHLSYAMVNLRPLVPGHVLVCPRREVKRFVDLTTDETSDLWITAQKDGPQAGQTVPHVHIHILPRKGGDFEKNDEVYDALDEKEKELKEKLDLDKERKDRSLEEMEQEAEDYKKLF